MSRDPLKPVGNANILGYIVKIKDNATGITADTTVNDILNRGVAILRRKRPAGNNVPSITNIYAKTIRGFAIPIVSEAYINSLSTDDDVQFVEPDIEVNAFAQTIPWGVTRIGTMGSTVASINGAGQIATVNIFILDTGVAVHPDLNRVEARSFVPREASVDDLNGHGTAVAGVVAAKDDTDGIVGVCPGAPIRSYKCLDKNGSGQLSWIIAALEAVYNWKTANYGALAVVNMSLGGYTGSFTYTSLDYAVKKVIDHGIPVVVAAGNSGDMAELYTPAHTAEAITVGAYDYTNTMTTWSNFGAVVDILAPGANILTTSINVRNRKPTYATFNGTSFSAPHVAGAVALYLHNSPSSTPEAVRNALLTLSTNATLTDNPKIVSSFPNTTNNSIYVAGIDA